MAMTGRQADQLRTKAEQVCDSARDVQDNLKDLGTTATRAAREQFRHMQSQAAECMDQGQERAREFLASGKSRVSDLEQTLEMRIQDQPLKAVMIAAGIGFLIGAVCLRRSR